MRMLLQPAAIGDYERGGQCPSLFHFERAFGGIGREIFGIASRCHISHMALARDRMINDW
ncbi:MAG: hypothetical protein AB7U49_13270 [Hyphomicrobiaceae bacterium]